MAAALDWEKVNRQRRVTSPTPTLTAITQPQIDFILGLCHQKNVTVKMPSSKSQAGAVIDWLKTLPDVNKFQRVRNGRVPQPIEARVVSPATVRKEVVNELQDAFPVLTPMTAHSLVQLAEATFDPLEIALFASEVIDLAEVAPPDLEKLVPWLMRRFLAFSAD